MVPQDYEGIMKELQTTSARINTEKRKALGAYYTDQFVSDFLVAWSVQRGTDVVLDPGFGGGAFLRSACNRISAMGGNPSDQVIGLEISSEAHSLIADSGGRDLGLSAKSLSLCNFFDLAPATYQADAVVGNPPFVRYQRFNGEQRRLALKRAKEQGVDLSELASSWAPFLVHAVSMVKRGGRLAMVAPFELGQASYAVPVLEHLVRSFGQVTLLTFREKLFDSLNEDTLLVLAAHKGSRKNQLRMKDFLGPKSLVDLLDSRTQDLVQKPVSARILNHDSLLRGKEKIIHYLIPERVRRLYQECKSLPEIGALGDLAHVGIGYVTGANHFFHVSPNEVKRWQIPEKYLRPAIRRGRILDGTRFTLQDWEANLDSGETGYLLLIEDEPSSIPATLLNYLNRGVEIGIPTAFKCRTRSPWYKVPHVYCPDAFLTYMSGSWPKLVANSAELVAPNSLHVVRLKRPCTLQAETLAALWPNSLTRLSAEIEGHALGGGMLKMEPTEARRVILPVITDADLVSFGSEVDQLCRSSGVEAARRLVDEEILQRTLGFSKKDVEQLTKGGQMLAERRIRRGKGDGSAA